MRRKQLEIMLSSLRTNPTPKLRFEQYDLDSVSASTMLHIAASLGDVGGRRIVDLGCGTGILSIGAAIMGARYVVGIDINRDSIGIAIENMENKGVRVEFIAGTIDCVRGAFDTTIMNPPFGSWKRGLDLKFLEKATTISDVVYSVHKSNEESDLFLRRKIRMMGKTATRLARVDITLARVYSFHSKARYRVRADLYRIGREDHHPSER